jgi:hypothetical protein
VKALILVLVGLAALGPAASASATCIGPPEVTLLPTGPSPSTLTVSAGASIMFRKSEPEGESRIAFDSASCKLDYSELTPCVVTVPTFDANDEIRPYWTVANEFWAVGSFTYRVEGFGAGTGTVVVRPSGRIVASRSVVTYGSRVALSGGISFGSCGLPPSGPQPPPPEDGVTVMARPFGLENFNSVAATVTRRGFWNAYPRPLIETTYRIYYVDPWGTGGRSEDIVVRVRPKVTLRVLAPGTFATHVTALSSYAGKRAEIQRRQHGRWTTIRVVRLDRHSRVHFHLSTQAGTQIRALVPQAQAQPGYVAGFSRSLRVAS